MYIEYIKLINFKRMPLRDQEVFEHTFTPDKKLTMISGPNGSGKSSLFNELTPLPSDKNDFLEGGYKEIHIEHKGNKYILTSDFTGKGAKFRFNMNGEEINPSHNVTTQRTLVLRHFNISQVSHDIFTGKEHFTNMSLLARKKLFNTITHLNIDRVLDAYDLLKEDLRNNELLLKTQASILQREEAKLADESRVENLTKTLTETREYSEHLLEMRSELRRHSLELDCSSVYSRHKELTDTVVKFKKDNYILLTAYPEGDLERYRVNYLTELELTKTNLSNIYRELEAKDRERKALSLVSSVNLEELEKEEAILTIEEMDLAKGLVYIKDLDKIEQYANDIYQLEVGLPDILSEMDSNPRTEGKLRYSRDVANHMVEALQRVTETVNSSIKEEIKLTKEIEDLENTNDNTTCPSCDYSWSPRDIPQLLLSAKQQLEVVLDTKGKANVTLARLTKSIDEQRTYFDLHNRLSKYIASSSVTLGPMWNVVNELDLVFESPESIMGIVADVAIDLRALRRMSEIKATLSVIYENLNTLNSLRNTNLSKLDEEVSRLHETATHYLIVKDKLINHLTNIDRADGVYKSVQRVCGLISDSTNTVTALNLSLTVEDVIRVLDTELTKSKVILVETENELSQHKTIMYSVNQAKKLIDEYKENSKVLNIALNELSPKDGLIAKSVSSFLNNIISNINSTIRGIWDYKMVLRPIDVGSEALNYKFKVEVEDKMVIDDINTVSNGMKEIINLSFKLVLYKLLDMEGSALFLDEFGLALDTSHRAKLFNLIFSLINNSSFYSQVFMVTHVDTSIANFKDTEVIEL